MPIWPDLSGNTYTDQPTAPFMESYAGAGTTQADATQIRAGLAKIATGATNSGVRLPKITRIGQECIVWNATANTINCYPAVGDTIKLLAAGVAQAHSTNVQRIYRAFSLTQWGFV